jgi:hypothetical protein
MGMAEEQQVEGNKTVLIASTDPDQPPYSMLQSFSQMVIGRHRRAALAFCITMLGLITGHNVLVSLERTAMASSNGTTAGGSTSIEGEVDGACSFVLTHSVAVGQASRAAPATCHTSGPMGMPHEARSPR